jgi:peptide/nickel transport system substrate-binding protein
MMSLVVRLRALRGCRVAALVATTLLISGCASSPSPNGPATPGAATPTGMGTPAAGAASPSAPVGASPDGTSPPRGGTLRVALAGDVVGLRDPTPDVLDPQLDLTLYESLELWRCCLVRTLLSHNGQSAAEGGARLQPDLAASLPEVSADGLTWTFRLKPGLHYGPPLEDVEITAGDFVRDFHRLLAPSIGSYFAYDYLVIEGAAEYFDGTAASISGIEAPDDHTLVFRLTEPAGDFGARLAGTSTGPLPPNPAQPDATTGIAAGADAGYGRFLVSSGPYMLEGSEMVDFSVPAAMRTPAAGFTPGRIVLVRNPSWDPASDDLRPAYADRIEITLADSMDAAVAALDAGEADLLWASGARSPTVPADIFDAFRADPARGEAHLDATGLVRNVIMNVAVPPFDDVHVRKALNWAIDKQKLVDLKGGGVAQGVYGHILGNLVEDDLLADYDPYATPGGHGDLEKARAEMRLSRYDTDGDGRCDAPACAHIRATTREEHAVVAREIADELAQLGIGLEVDVLDNATFFDIDSHPTDKVPLLIGIGFGRTFISASQYMSMFDGRLTVDVPPDTYNNSMLGATPEQLKRWGYEVTEVPNVDARVEACLPLVGAAQFQCWAGLDQYLMENVGAWVPYAEQRFANLTSPRVASWAFDAMTNNPALDQLAVQP